MDTIEKEIERVVKKAALVAGPPAGTSTAATTRKSSSRAAAAATTTNVPGAIDELLATLEKMRSNLHAAADPASSSSAPPPAPAVLASELTSLLNSTSKSVAASQKEYYNALAKYSKALDRRFPTPIDGVADPALFTSPAARRALDLTVREHLLRCGEWDVAELLEREAGLEEAPRTTASVFRDLNAILSRIHRGDLEPAIRWASAHSDFLASRRSGLEFALHRSQFLQIALNMRPDSESEYGGGDDDDDDDDDDGRGRGEALESMAVDGSSREGGGTERTHLRGSGGGGGGGGGGSVTASNVEKALAYGREHFAAFAATLLPEIQRLFSFLLFLPAYDFDAPQARGLGTEMHLSRSLLRAQVPAPYRGFLDERAMHAPLLAPMFELEYCCRHGVARHPPLKVAVEIGAGGALNRIVKVRSLMKQSGNEWSQADELPVEIPLPPHLRFHSTFACPVSKEQATNENPPVMMACGHVICLESLARLGKGNGRVKCPYCPVEATVKQATRVYF